MLGKPANLLQPSLLAAVTTAALLLMPGVGLAASGHTERGRASVQTCARAGARGAGRRARFTCAKPRTKPAKRRRARPTSSSAPHLTATPRTISTPATAPALVGASTTSVSGEQVSGSASPPASPGGSGEEDPALFGPSTAGGATEDPIDPRFLTADPFGTTSFWIQPWRAYMDTWPVSRLRDALGINFDVQGSAIEPTARLLQESGFKLARIGINWEALSYEHPTQFTNEAGLRARLTALGKHGLRPLILLDANSQAPAPSKRITLTTLTAAPAGAQTVQLDAESAAQVTPGKTGFDQLAFGGNPDILIASVRPGNVAVLSRALPSELPAGPHKGTTLLYAPFGPPTLPDGSPNPLFRETMNGWLGYVASVCRLASEVLGPEGFDLEVWNELSFGSQFLNSGHYYSGASESADEEGEEGLETAETQAEETELVQGTSGGAHTTREVSKALLAETVAFVRNPANGVSRGVGISDGFASQSPFPSGALAPVGLTALSKHLYNNPKLFPAAYREGSLRPLNALGQRDTVSAASKAPLFIPDFESAFPEFFLTALSTESVVRDLAPATSTVYGSPHGREVGPAGGAPVQKWMTEYNLNPGKGTVMGPDGVTAASGPTAKLTPADKQHFQAKALLRSLVAMISKGMTREYFFDAAPGPLSLIGEEFNQAIAKNPNNYPGTQTAGQTITALHNLLTQFQDPGPQNPTRQLRLTNISQTGDHAQFQGDGTPQHPNLYDREVLAVLPFQASPTKFVIPIYVMTRNLLTLYKPNAATTDTTRYDLPNETFHITLTNLPQTTNQPTITSYDPLHNQATPARLLARHADAAEIELAATDYPRILTIEYPSS